MQCTHCNELCKTQMKDKACAPKRASPRFLASVWDRDARAFSRAEGADIQALLSEWRRACMPSESYALAKRDFESFGCHTGCSSAEMRDWRPCRSAYGGAVEKSMRGWRWVGQPLSVRCDCRRQLCQTAGLAAAVIRWMKGVCNAFEITILCVRRMAFVEIFHRPDMVGGCVVSACSPSCSAVSGTGGCEI